MRPQAPERTAAESVGPRVVRWARHLLVGLLLPVLVDPAALAGQDRADIFVANLSGNHVARFEGETGRHLGAFVPAGSAGLRGGTGIAFGPDGRLYVASSGSDQILRFDGESGEFVDVFAESPDVLRPFSMAFGPDGRLYVSSGDRILRFAPDGRPLGPVIEEGLQTPIGLRFDARGALWIANAGAHEILRVDPETGARLGAALTAEEMRFPSDLVLTRDGRALVSSAFSSSIVGFDASSGAYLGVLVRLPDDGVPVGLALQDEDAVLIADFRRHRLWRFDLDAEELHLFSDEGLNQPENLVIGGRR